VPEVKIVQPWVNQIDDLARVGALPYEREQNDRKRSCDDLNRRKVATTWRPRRLEIEGRVRSSGGLEIKGLAGHFDNVYSMI
jgi:hypothetical protein